MAASPSTRSTGDPQTGHFDGATIDLAPRGRFSRTTCTTSGITSPARRTITVSPRWMSLRAISSMLCSVALLTVAPPTSTGSRRATGVSAPVRPTWKSTDLSTVRASSAGNLCATAHRGAREAKPSFS